MERGRFRGVEMDDLAAWANSPLFDDELSKNRYRYPLRVPHRLAVKEGNRLAAGISQEEVSRCGRFVCARSPGTHKGPFRHAVDFLVPDGTEVCAAAAGTIIECVENHQRWGDGPEFRDELNFMTIKHDNGEYTQYCHLAKESVAARGLGIGSSVSSGQCVALVGKNGWTDRDHLHFIVFRSAQNESPFAFKSLVPRFRFLW